MARVWLGEDDPQRDLTGGDGEGEGNDYLAGTDEPGMAGSRGSGGRQVPGEQGRRYQPGGAVPLASRLLVARPPSQRFMSIAVRHCRLR